MKVHELIDALQQFDHDAEVIGTWEGITEELSVYLAADGRVLVDADYENYRERFQKTPCAVCGKQATGRPYLDQPVCSAHWNAFAVEIDDAYT